MGNFMEFCSPAQNCCDTHSRQPSQQLQNIIKDNYSENSDESASEIEKIGKVNMPKDILNIPLYTNSLVVERSVNPLNFYEELETIGSGAYGSVKKVCLKSNPDTIRAMKIISRKNLLKGINDISLVEEIYILKNLDHPNIMKIYEFFADDKNFYIISEFFDQGDLFTKIEKLGSLNQIVVKFIMEQIFNAVAYLHSKGVLHGDIKLENVMLYTTSKKVNQRFTMINKKLDLHKSLEKDLKNYFSKNYNSLKAKKVVENITDYEIKLIDFGCSKLFSKKNHKKIRGIIGTSLYCSPEVINNLYDEKCDEWSCGVMMYILLSGHAPFPGKTDEEIFERIKKCDFNFDLQKFQNVSDNCKDLIRRLLEPDIKKRIKASEALRHPFFTETFNPNKALTQNKDLSILDKLFNIKPLPSKFHEAIIAFLCSNYINKDEEKRLREMFRYIDKEGKNFLTKKSIEKILNENGYLATKDKIDNIMKSIDSDSNGTIEYQEFLRALCDKESLFSDNNLKSAFDCIDEDMKGFISSNNIKNFIFQGMAFSDEMISEYLNQFGMKIKDKLTYNDFVYLLKSNKILNEFGNTKEKKVQNINSNDDNIDLYFDIE